MPTLQELNDADEPEALRMLGKRGFDAIETAARPGVTPERLVASLKAQLANPKLTVRTGADLLGYYPFLDEGQEPREAADWVPLTHGRSLPGGAVPMSTYLGMKDAILAGIAAEGPFDALFLDIHGAMSVVGMDDAIEVALRKKKDSSMRVAIQQVKDGAAQAAVSAGNTGALMAVARYLLKTLDGIDRPAIATQIPNAKGGATTVLDLGANVDCTAEHLEFVLDELIGNAVKFAEAAAYLSENLGLSTSKALKYQSLPRPIFDGIRASLGFE